MTYSRQQRAKVPIKVTVDNEIKSKWLDLIPTPDTAESVQADAETPQERCLACKKSWRYGDPLAEFEVRMPCGNPFHSEPAPVSEDERDGPTIMRENADLREALDRAEATLARTERELHATQEARDDYADERDEARATLARALEAGDELARLAGIVVDRQPGMESWVAALTRWRSLDRSGGKS